MALHDEETDGERQPPLSEVTRRDFLKTVGTSGVATTIVGTGSSAEAQANRQVASATARRAVDAPPYAPIRQEVTENLRRRGIVGYADRLSVQPGETIRFMVSSERPRYRAQVVRLIHGDANPAGPGLKGLLVDTPLNGEYAGARQDLPLGSYVRVPDHPSLRLDGSFTVTAWIAPTSQRDRPEHRGRSSSAPKVCSPNGRMPTTGATVSSSMKTGDLPSD